MTSVHSRQTKVILADDGVCIFAPDGALTGRLLLAKAFAYICFAGDQRQPIDLYDPGGRLRHLSMTPVMPAP